jgi:inorganic pyrophosphatase
MDLSALPIGKNPPHEVNVVVEVPVGGEPIKYEMHKPSGALMVDRFLYTSMRYPGNYGFIPHTLSDAGGDEKILAVPIPKLTQRYQHVHNYTDLPEITVKQVQHFFEHYKDLEPGKWVKVLGWGDAAEARDMISAAIARAVANPGK